LNEIEKLVKQSEHLQEEGRIEDAEELIRHALYKYEESWQLQYQLGLILKRKRDFVEAADAFSAAINLEPEEFWPWLYLGRTQRELGDYEAAIESTENALRVEIDKKELNLAYYYLACYYAFLGRNEEAMDFLRTALENDESLREWAREDADLNSLRNMPGFEFLAEG